MSSTTEICNMALSHLGVGKDIGNVDTEPSAEARACRRFFTIVRDIVLTDFPWPFATKFADLGLVESDPTDEWSFSYRYPSDCIRMRRILSGIRVDTAASKVVFKLGRDDSGQLIYTDQVDAQAEYTILITSVEQYPADMVMALSLLLAATIAPRLTAGDPFKMGARALQMYRLAIQDAELSAIGEEQPDRPQESEFITGRE